MKLLGCSARERSILIKICQGSAIFVQILRMLCTGAQCSSIFTGCPARERDFERKNDEISRMLRTGAQFSSKFSGCPARERDFRPNCEDALHGSAIFIKFVMMLRTGARFSSNFRRCSARERDFRPNFQDAPHAGAQFSSKF